MAYDPMQDNRLDMRNRALLAGLEGPMMAYQGGNVASREKVRAAAVVSSRIMRNLLRPY